jgi:hypothetical protein
MYTTYGRQMPGHCAIYIGADHGRRLSCVRLEKGGDVTHARDVIVRFGAKAGEAQAPQRLNCTCAPVFDYTGREVARVGLFGHAVDDAALTSSGSRQAWELARLISLRLGHLPGAGAVAV